MNYMKKGLIIIVVALIFNVLETWFFGWNLHAQTTAEGFCDTFASTGILIGCCLIIGQAIGSTAVIRIGEEDTK